MLSIYYKMTLATQPVPSWKARNARRISNCQNLIVTVYCVTYTAFLWVFHYLLEYTDPVNELSHMQQTAFIFLIVPKFLYEISILVICMGLFRKFNSLSQDYQAE